MLTFLDLVLSCTTILLQFSCCVGILGSCGIRVADKVMCLFASVLLTWC